MFSFFLWKFPLCAASISPKVQIYLPGINFIYVLYNDTECTELHIKYINKVVGVVMVVVVVV